MPNKLYAPVYMWAFCLMQLIFVVFTIEFGKNANSRYVNTATVLHINLFGDSRSLRFSCVDFG